MIALIAMGGLGIIFAAFLTIASKKLKVEEDPAVEKVMEALRRPIAAHAAIQGAVPRPRRW